MTSKRTLLATGAAQPAPQILQKAPDALNDPAKIPAQALIAAQDLVLQGNDGQPRESASPPQKLPEPEKLVNVEAISGTPEQQFALFDAELLSTQNRYLKANAEYVIRAGTILNLMKERGVVQGYSSVIEYAQDRFGIEKSRAYQLMARAPQLAGISKILEASPQPLAESGALVVVRIAEQFGAKKAREVLRERAEEGDKLTAKVLENSWAALQPKPKALPAPPKADPPPAPPKSVPEERAPAAEESKVLDSSDADGVEDTEVVSPSPAPVAPSPVFREAAVAAPVQEEVPRQQISPSPIHALMLGLQAAEKLEQLVTKDVLAAAEEADPATAADLRAKIHMIVLKMQVVARAVRTE